MTCTESFSSYSHHLILRILFAVNNGEKNAKNVPHNFTEP